MNEKAGPKAPSDGTGRLTLLDIEAVAQRLGVGERFVRRLVFERRITYVKVGRHVRFEPAVIERWIADARQESEPARWP